MNKIWEAFFNTGTKCEYGDFNDVDTWEDLFWFAEVYKNSYFSKTEKARFQNLLKEIAIKSDEKYHYSNFTKKYYEKVIRKMFEDADLVLFSTEDKDKDKDNAATALRFKDLEEGTAFTVDQYKDFVFKKICTETIKRKSVNGYSYEMEVNTVILMAPSYDKLHSYLLEMNKNTIVQKVDETVKI